MNTIKSVPIFLALLGLSLIPYACKTAKTTQNNSTKTTQTANADEIESLYKSLETGGNIQLPRRIYQLDRPLRIVSKENLSLDGGGSTFVMKDKDADVVFVENSNNIILKNFKATHIEPEGPIGCTGSVIQVFNNKNVLIKNCQLNGSGIIGVVSYETRQLKITDSYIYNNSAYGVLYDGDTSLEIKNNTFENNGQSGSDHVAKALNAGLSEVEKMENDTHSGGLKMSGNKFK